MLFTNMDRNKIEALYRRVHHDLETHPNVLAAATEH